MTDGFVKIYGDKLIASSLWDEAPEARLVFLGMLALAGPDGRVDAPNERVLARLLNLPPDWITKALAVLEAPDDGSRSKEHEGRRVLREESGWRCVNYEKYREYRSVEQEKKRLKVAQWREKKEREEAIRLGRSAIRERQD